MKKNVEKKIVLSKNIQLSMLDFFLRTSIPRKIREKSNHLSNEKEDR